MEQFKLIMDLHKIMKDQKIDLIYEGEFNQEVTKLFTGMTEKNLADVEQDESTKKRVFHVMVECLQNICKHSSDEDKGGVLSGNGVFVVGHNDMGYLITSGNKVSADNKIKISSMLSKFNELSEDEIKEEYKKLMKESRISDKGGAGLGFIDIIKKTGNKIIYYFEEISDNEFYFIQRSTITKK